MLKCGRVINPLILPGTEGFWGMQDFNAKTGTVTGKL